MNKKLLTLAAITFAVTSCASLPPVPYVEIGLVDFANGKHHVYQLPQKRGVNAKLVRSETLDLRNLNKRYTLEPKYYSALEQYISAVEDVAEQRCK